MRGFSAGCENQYIFSSSRCSSRCSTAAGRDAYKSQAAGIGCWHEVPPAATYRDSDRSTAHKTAVRSEKRDIKREKKLSWYWGRLIPRMGIRRSQPAHQQNVNGRTLMPCSFGRMRQWIPCGPSWTFKNAPTPTRFGDKNDHEHEQVIKLRNKKRHGKC